MKRALIYFLRTVVLFS